MLMLMLMLMLMSGNIVIVLVPVPLPKAMGAVPAPLYAGIREPGGWTGLLAWVAFDTRKKRPSRGECVERDKSIVSNAVCCMLLLRLLPPEHWDLMIPGTRHPAALGIFLRLNLRWLKGG
jgi:hypothetical protein